MIKHNLVVFRNGEAALQVSSWMFPSACTASLSGRLAQPAPSVCGSASGLAPLLGRVRAGAAAIAGRDPGGTAEPRHLLPAERAGAHCSAAAQGLQLTLPARARRRAQVIEAYNLIKELEPATPQEYILKGVVNACIGQMQVRESMLSAAV